MSLPMGNILSEAKENEPVYRNPFLETKIETEEEYPDLEDKAIKELKQSDVAELLYYFLRLFPNLGDKGTTFKNKNGDSKSTPSLKRKVNLDLEEGISSAKRRCKD